MKKSTSLPPFTRSLLWAIRRSFPFRRPMMTRPGPFASRISAPKATTPTASAAGGSKPANVPPSGVGPPTNATRSAVPCRRPATRMPSRLAGEDRILRRARTLGRENRKPLRPGVEVRAFRRAAPARTPPRSAPRTATARRRARRRGTPRCRRQRAPGRAGVPAMPRGRSGRRADDADGWPSVPTTKITRRRRPRRPPVWRGRRPRPPAFTLGTSDDGKLRIWRSAGPTMSPSRTTIRTGWPACEPSTPKTPTAPLAQLGPEGDVSRRRSAMRRRGPERAAERGRDRRRPPPARAVGPSPRKSPSRPLAPDRHGKRRGPAADTPIRRIVVNAAVPVRAPPLVRAIRRRSPSVEEDPGARRRRESP